MNKSAVGSVAKEEKILAALEAPFEVELTASNVKGAMKEHGASSSDLWKVPYKSIRVIPGFQPKVKNASYMAHVREIADSMKQPDVGWVPNSVLAGFVGKDERTGEAVIFVTDGHTRLLALETALKEGAEISDKVPVVVQPAGTSMDDLNVQLIRVHKNRGLSPYETGVVLKRLLKAGHSEADVQKLTGVKDPWFSSLLRLMAAPKELKHMVAYETIAATFAIEMIDTHGGTKALALIEQSLQAKLAAAQEKGIAPENVRVTGRNIAKTVDERVEREISRYAPVMHSTIEKVYKDPAFGKLNKETRELLSQLIDGFQTARAEIEEKDAKAAKRQEAKQKKAGKKAEFESRQGTLLAADGAGGEAAQ